jgi:AMMECR1 domain-containing protein
MMAATHTRRALLRRVFALLLPFGGGARAWGQAPQDTRIDALIALARATVRAVVEGSPLPPLPPENERTPARGVFVTIERNKVVLGCRGCLGPLYESLEKEVAEAARSAAASDPRYRPVTPTDLKDFLITVTIVERLEPLGRGAVFSLKPQDGLVLTAGGRTGVVLPYEGKYPAIRLRWAYRKAGVTEGGACTLQRMTAERYRG